MRQLRDDDLILFFYGEADDTEDADEIRRRLAESAELRVRYDVLCRTLEMAREALPVPERPDSFGAEVWERLQPRLAKQPPPPRVETLGWMPLPLRGHFPSRRKTAPEGHGRIAQGFNPGIRWGAGLAAAAVLLLAVGFLAGRFWPSPSGQRTENVYAAARERILVSTVAAHLERSERLFTELANARTDGSVDISAERRWAQDLLAANRLYRQSARQAGRPRLTSILSQLEPFLLELSHGPDEIPADDFADFRTRLNDQSLLFKMRIVSERLAGQQTL